MDSYIKINSDSTKFFTTPSFARLVYHPFSIVIISKEEPKKITISYFEKIEQQYKNLSQKCDDMEKLMNELRLYRTSNNISISDFIK